MRALVQTTVVLVALASAAPVTPLAAQDRPESGPMLEARLQTYKRAGGAAGMAKVYDWVIVGQGMKWFLTAGAGPGDTTLCGYSAGDVGTVGEKLARSHFVWELKATPSKYENGSTTFDLEWARYQSDGTGRPAAEGKSTLTLREGERKSLDLVHTAPGTGSCDNDTAVVDVAAVYKESPQFADAMLEYEIWLTHRRASNEAIVRKFVGTGRQGAEV